MPQALYKGQLYHLERVKNPPLAPRQQVKQTKAQAEQELDQRIAFLASQRPQKKRSLEESISSSSSSSSSTDDLNKKIKTELGEPAGKKSEITIIPIAPQDIMLNKRFPLESYPKIRTRIAQFLGKPLSNAQSLVARKVLCPEYDYLAQIFSPAAYKGIITTILDYLPQEDHVTPKDW